MDSLLRLGFAGQLSTFHVHDTIKSTHTTHRGTVPTSCTAFLNSSDSLMLVLPPRSSYRNKMTIIIQTNSYVHFNLFIACSTVYVHTLLTMVRGLNCLLRKQNIIRCWKGYSM